MRITGPASQLDMISKVNAVSNKSLTLDSSYILTSDEVQLLTEDNAEIDKSNLNLSTNNFNINIPVRTQKTVDLTVSLVNAPSSFDPDCLDFIFSTSTVTLAASSSQTVIPETLDIGKIDLTTLNLGYSNTFRISSVLEGRDLVNVSGTDEVTVTLNTEGLEQIELTLDKKRISLSNMPAGNYSYSVLTQKLPVTVIGPKEIISELTAEDINADVNLLNAEILSDVFSYPASFTTKYNNVWAITDTRVSIQRTAEAPSTSNTSPADAQYTTASV